MSGSVFSSGFVSQAFTIPVLLVQECPFFRKVILPNMMLSLGELEGVGRHLSFPSFASPSCTLQYFALERKNL